MEQTPVGQRIKFLIDKLGLSARAFSVLIDESPTNTQNYIGKRNSIPGADYLEKIANHFEYVNPIWLFTGKGEPFSSEPPASIKQTGKFNQAGTGNKQNNNSAAQEPPLKAALESANMEIALLREQLTTKDQLIAAKEEMLVLLRSQFNRPN